MDGKKAEKAKKAKRAEKAGQAKALIGRDATGRRSPYNTSNTSYTGPLGRRWPLPIAITRLSQS